MRRDQPTALIVGAFIGGLAAGLALSRAGWKITIIERRATPGELGYALTLAPNALDALRELQVADAVLTGSVLITAGAAGEVRRTDGRVLRRAVVRLGGELALVTLRPVLHRALLSAVGPESVLLNSEVVQIDTDTERATVTLRSGLTLRGDVVVGADGIGSAVRRHLHRTEPAPRHSGLVELRGVTSAVPSQFEGLTGIVYFGPHTLGAVARVAPDTLFWFLSIPGRVRQAEELTARERLQGATVGFDPLFREVMNSTRPDDLRVDDAIDRDPLAAWGHGRITLLGDAAHPMLPHAGQGAAQALEDAVALGLARNGPGMWGRRFGDTRPSGQRARVGSSCEVDGAHASSCVGCRRSESG